MPRIVPPVVVVEPAHELTGGPGERRRACVDLPAPLVGNGGDPRVAQAERGLDPLAVAVVDDDRLPVGPVLDPPPGPRPFEEPGRRQVGMITEASTFRLYC